MLTVKTMRTAVIKLQATAISIETRTNQTMQTTADGYRYLMSNEQ